MGTRTQVAVGLCTAFFTVALVVFVMMIPLYPDTGADVPNPDRYATDGAIDAGFAVTHAFFSQYLIFDK